MTIFTHSKQNAKLGLLASCVISVLLVAACLLAGCAAKQQVPSQTPSQESSQAVSVDSSGMDFGYTDADKDASWDEASATQVTLAQGSISVKGSGASVQDSVLTISEAGSYVLSGTLSDGQIVVEAGENDKVKLVLNGVSVTCSTGPAIYIKQADKAFITLASGSLNSLSDTANYTLEEGSDEPYATLFSKDDLSINGGGTLEVNALYKHAICSKDDLVITDGTFKITALEDAVRGRDCVKICGGTFDITAQGDGIKSNNDEEATRGFVSIDGGSFNISAGDDGVHAETVLIVNDGFVTVSKSYEGFEAQEIYINGGSNIITASDDGINAAKGGGSVDEFKQNGGKPGTGMFDDGLASGDDTCILEINGGYTVVDSLGDGIDTNGSLSVKGGVTLVSGPTDNGNGALDWDLSASISGGVFIATGSSGMAQSFDSNSSQAFITTSVSGNAGELLSISDSSAHLLCSFLPQKSYDLLVVSTAEMVAGSSYTVNLGGTITNADVNGYADKGTVSEATAVTSAEAGTQSLGNFGRGAVQGGGGNQGGQPNAHTKERDFVLP